MKIVHYPHPALRHPAKPVPLIDNEIRRLVGQLFEAMYKHRGLGLAAPQVAVPFQVFVMHPEGDAEKPELGRVYVNPTIVEKKGIVEADEGCLSFPELYQKVRRAKTVRVQSYDQNGQPREELLADLEARIIQHETDHLHGKLFIDYFGTVAKLGSRTALAVFEQDHRKAQQRGELPPDKDLVRQLRKLEEELAARAAPPSQTAPAL